MQTKTTQCLFKSIFSLILILWPQLAGAQSYPPAKGPFLVVLGIAQDAGYPQIACNRECCTPAWAEAKARRNVASLGLIDPATRQYWLIDATPDIRLQLRMLHELAPDMSLAGVFLTHAHIGHYTGLMHLGREAMGAQDVPVFAMPRMRRFLRENGPWDQLLRLENISLQPLTADSTRHLSAELSITPVRVPHRDEYSETVGFRIATQRKSILYIPDIDKWEKWQRQIERELRQVDIAFLDGTFFQNGELPGRDMSEIPHPFISETMQRLARQPDMLKKKVFFIHFNHTNPVLRQDTEARREITRQGFGIAEQGMIIPLTGK